MITIVALIGIVAILAILGWGFAKMRTRYAELSRQEREKDVDWVDPDAPHSL